MDSRRRHSPCDCPGRRPSPVTRRELLAGTANGFGWLAVASLLGESGAASTRAAEPGLPSPHFAPKARNVIFCFMDGGVSHVDTFDPKPKLVEFDGRAFTGSKNPTANVNRKWLKSPWS